MEVMVGDHRSIHVASSTYAICLMMCMWVIAYVGLLRLAPITFYSSSVLSLPPQAMVLLQCTALGDPTPLLHMDMGPSMVHLVHMATLPPTLTKCRERFLNCHHFAASSSYSRVKWGQPILQAYMYMMGILCCLTVMPCSLLHLPPLPAISRQTSCTGLFYRHYMPPPPPPPPPCGALELVYGTAVLACVVCV